MRRPLGSTWMFVRTSPDLLGLTDATSNCAGCGPDAAAPCRTVTGGRGLVIGALVPLVYFMSSVVQTVIGSGVPAAAFRTGATASVAIGPWSALPPCSNRIIGGVLCTEISENGLIT